MNTQALLHPHLEVDRMKIGEATCRTEHAKEWTDEGRVNPCAWCYIAERAVDIAHATVERDGDEH